MSNQEGKEKGKENVVEIKVEEFKTIRLKYKQMIMDVAKQFVIDVVHFYFVHAEMVSN